MFVREHEEKARRDEEMAGTKPEAREDKHSADAARILPFGGDMIECWKVNL